jgi:hypothetical protein
MKYLIIICLLLPIFINADCENGIKDVDEADVDCGMQCFALCDVGKACESDYDCESWKCEGKKCAEDIGKMRMLAASGPSNATTTSAPSAPSGTTSAPKAAVAAGDKTVVNRVTASLLFAFCILNLL